MPGSRPRFSVASRSGGAKACARAAYRAGERIEDRTYGETHDYSGKAKGVLHSEINAPKAAPDWVYDRAELWNRVEESELKRDGTVKVKAQLARDVVVPLPHELTLDENRELMREWVAGEFVSKGMVADWSIHEADREGDGRNIHAHVMLTMRAIGPDGFDQDKMKVREWNSTDLVTGSVDRFEDMQNRELERRGIEARANFDSFETRGIDREAQQHEGAAVTNMRRKDKETRIGRENDAREQRNTERTQRHVDHLKELARIEAERAKFEDWAAAKAGKLESDQDLARLDLKREQERAAADFKQELNETYDPSIKTMQAEADRLNTRLTAPGLRASFRRMWSGRADRRELDSLKASIADGQQRKAEQWDRYEARQETEQARLRGLQEQRRQQQAEGIQKARERKEDGLAAQPAQERPQEQETASGNGLADRLKRARTTERKSEDTERTRQGQDRSSNTGREMEP